MRLRRLSAGSRGRDGTVGPGSARRAFLLGLCAGLAGLFALRLLTNETRFADWLVAPLLLSDTTGRAEAMVVMGAGVVGQCGTNENGVRRVLLALRLWREGRAPIIIFTGGRARGDAGCSVGQAMARLGMDVGIPGSVVRIESASRNTRENAEMAAPLLRRLGATRVLVVTDRLHMPRSARTFVQLGFAVERASVPIYEGHHDNVSMLTAGAREMAALWYYGRRGWLADLDGSGNAESMPVTQTGAENRMPPRMAYPDGPIVILGASYAGGWALKAIDRAPVVNTSVPGQQSFEMAERFETDVLARHARAVILWGFINDVFRAPAGGVNAALARARQSYTGMVSLARASGIEPILVTEVTIRPPRSWSDTLGSWGGALLGRTSYQDRINAEVIGMNRWLVDLARQNDLQILDFQSTLAEAGGRRRRIYALPDGSHISAEGYTALTNYAVPILKERLSRQSP